VSCVVKSTPEEAPPTELRATEEGKKQCRHIAKSTNSVQVPGGAGLVSRTRCQLVSSNFGHELACLRNRGLFDVGCDSVVPMVFNETMDSTCSMVCLHSMELVGSME
jgi:hypothetical protein